MTERGGPTTQSEIIYQNSITALYLGRLCDSTPRPDRHAVVEFRAEAPTDVDDTVVTYRDGHRKLIQAKENVRDNDAAWGKLRKDFEAQFWGGDFRKGIDRLLLYVGEIYEEHRALKAIGLVEVGYTDGKHGGNEYAVHLPEEIGLKAQPAPPTGATPPRCPANQNRCPIR